MPTTKRTQLATKTMKLLAAGSVMIAGCSSSGNSGYYNTNDPLDDKTPAVIRQQVRDVWRSMNSTMRDAICYDVAVLDPKAAIALLQAGGDELGPGEAEIAYYEYRDLCS